MGDVIHTEEGAVRLEQVVLNMPEARFYFSGGGEMAAENLRAFIGEEELSPVSLKRFSETGEGVCYYVLLDISASISESEFAEIKEALADFCEGLEAQDRMVLLTFGEQVQTLLDEGGEALREGSGRERILSLQNTDQRTLLFEAVDRMAEMADADGARESLRRAALVITDGEDIARGRATRQEAEQTLRESGIPVYGFTVSGAGKEATDAFGEFSRASGGTLTILEPGEATQGLAAVKDELLSSWEAVFEADSNRVANGMVNVSLEFSDTGEKKQTEAMQNRWQADEEAPVVLEAAVEGEKQLRVTFSEAVTGAQAAEHYELVPVTEEETGTEAETREKEKASGTSDASGKADVSVIDGQSLIPVYASAQEGGTEAVLTFDALPAGAYELHCVGLKDVSMEENEMDSAVSVLVEGETERTAAEQTSSAASSGIPAAAAAAGALIVVLAVVFLFFRKKKAQKREGDRRTGRDGAVPEGTGSLKDAASGAAGTETVGVGLQPNRRVKVERRQLEELTVHFQAKGQKEEITVVIQKSMIVGRSAACELSFDDPALSRQHFALQIENGGLWIRNLSQSGFTLLNGVKLQEKAVRLNSGDWISAGQLQLRLRF